MKELVNIEQLIQDLCPSGVDYVALEDACSIVNAPKKLQTKEYKEIGLYPIIDQGKDFIVGYTDDKDALLSKAEYILFGDHTREVKYANFPFAQGADGLKILKARRDILPKFLYYALQNLQITNRGYNRHWSIVKEMFIPNPPLQIQQTISQILEVFEKLIINIEQEICEREILLAQCRVELIEGVKCNSSVSTIEKVCINCYPGATPSTKKKEYWSNGTIPWMSSGEVHQGRVTITEKCITELGYNNSSTKWVPVDSVVIALAGQGKTRGSVALTNIKLCTNQSLCALVPNKEKVLPDYLYQYLKTQYNNLRNISSGDGARGGLTLAMIKDYPIHLPSLKEQQAIAAKLDTIEAFIANLNEERTLRQQQYEYYRAKLISLLK